MQNPVPGLVLPAPNSKAIPGRQQDNNNALGRWAKTVGPRLWKVGTPIYAPNGAPPTPPSDAYLGQRGIVQVTLAGGSAVLTLPDPFPNGWLSLGLTGQGGAGGWSYTPFGVTLGTIEVFFSGSNGLYNIDIDAVGW